MPLPSSATTALPLFCIEKGRVVLPGPHGWLYARNEGGDHVDPFDVADFLFEKYQRIYFLDVDGLKSSQPQLDYLQELSRGREIWAEVGPRNAEQVIDVLVAGATRAVLSLDLLPNPESEVRHTLAMTDEIAVLINTDGEEVKSEDPAFRKTPLAEVCSQAKLWGVPILILPNADVGWETISHIAAIAPVYVKGVRPEEAESLRASKAAGAVMEVPLHE